MTPIIHWQDFATNPPKLDRSNGYYTESCLVAYVDPDSGPTIFSGRISADFGYNEEYEYVLREWRLLDDQWMPRDILPGMKYAIISEHVTFVEDSISS